ncbi:MAG: CpsB/CapC family capsule biosynthesis tyrosine phosphatase [Solirubrobacteraceae bacterium]|nr:CpsB/CapC family capsule biosynthesis tyrosine phosphatase [Solirubrobacteraceae bacterium]
MSGRIDLHCHLLPDLDDGPADDGDALALAWALVDDGVTTVAATPHRTARFKIPVLELRQRHAALVSMLAHHEVPLEVLLGSEVAVDALLDMDGTEIEALRIGETGPLLVELPQREGFGDPTWPVHEVLDSGVPVLLAHPERIPLLQADLAPLRALVERGAHAQVTSGAVIGRYGRTAQSVAMDMLAAGLIDVIASDAHHHERRPPETGTALEWLRTNRPEVDGDGLAVHTPRVLIPPRAPVS